MTGGFGFSLINGSGFGLADFGEDEIVEALAAPETEDTSEENAAGHAGNGNEGGVVGTGVSGESGDDPEENASEEAEAEATGCDGVGGAAAVDFDEEVTKNVSNREHDNSAVDRDAEEIPEFDGGEVSDDNHTTHDGAHNHEATGGFYGHG